MSYVQYNQQFASPHTHKGNTIIWPICQLSPKNTTSLENLPGCLFLVQKINYKKRIHQRTTTQVFITSTNQSAMWMFMSPYKIFDKVLSDATSNNAGGTPLPAQSLGSFVSCNSSPCKNGATRHTLRRQAEATCLSQAHRVFCEHELVAVVGESSLVEKGAALGSVRGASLAAVSALLTRSVQHLVVLLAVVVRHQRRERVYASSSQYRQQAQSKVTRCS